MLNHAKSCKRHEFRLLSAYLMHLRIRHANEANFRIICGLSECEYDKYASFYKHITRKHTDVIATCSDYSAHGHVTEINDIMDSDDDNVELHAKALDVHEMNERLCSGLGESMFKFSLKIREQFIIPAATHADIVQECTSMTMNVLTCQTFGK